MRVHQKSLVVATFAIMLFPGSAFAVSIAVGSNAGVWPAGPVIETFDPTGSANDNGAVGSNRVMGQSFQVPATFDLESIYFEAFSFSDGTIQYDVGLYEVADTGIQGNSDPGLGTLLAQGVGLLAPAGNSLEEVLRLDLNQTVTLNPSVGTEGYAVVFTSTNGVDFSTALSLSKTIDSFPLVNGSAITQNWGPTPSVTAFAFALTTPLPANLGDFNGDGSVTTADYDIMVANWFSTGNLLNENGEVNSDGKVDITDFKLFKETLFPGGASAFASATSVPEPNAFILLLAAAPAWLLIRSCRRQQL